jgi:uncharacterized Fe-S cluster-containing radical SAM superfamily enzyme
MRFFGKYKKDLIYSINSNRAIFVDEDLGLPLIGLNFLGILDKGSEIIEIKPITGCNADCNFCSVDEGLSSRKKLDFVVDKDYLVSQLNDLLEFKKAKGMEIWINPHGEPTLYENLAELCDDILENSFVSKVSVITNGVLLGKNMVDELKAIAHKQKKEIKIALSISDLSKKGNIMGKNYSIDAVLKNLDYIASSLPLSITPVWIKGINDNEIKNIIEFSKELSKKSKKHLNLDVIVSIQKFSANKFGRNPIKEKPWDEFFNDLKELEKETGVNLTVELGKLKETPELPLVCKKGDIIQVKILCEARNPKDRIGILETKSGNRAVALIGCNATKGFVKARVVQNKYNMIIAACS